MVHLKTNTKRALVFHIAAIAEAYDHATPRHRANIWIMCSEMQIQNANQYEQRRAVCTLTDRHSFRSSIVDALDNVKNARNEYTNLRICSRGHHTRMVYSIFKKMRRENAAWAMCEWNTMQFIMLNCRCKDEQDEKEKCYLFQYCFVHTIEANNILTRVVPSFEASFHILGAPEREQVTLTSTNVAYRFFISTGNRTGWSLMCG